jgi:hypothetical protein
MLKLEPQWMLVCLAALEQLMFTKCAARAYKRAVDGNFNIVMQQLLSN